MNRTFVGMQNRILDIMSASPVTVAMDDTVLRVEAVLDEHRIDHVVVVENGALMGIVSSLDVVAACLPPAAGEVPDSRGGSR